MLVECCSLAEISVRNQQRAPWADLFHGDSSNFLVWCVLHFISFFFFFLNLSYWEKSLSTAVTNQLCLLFSTIKSGFPWPARAGNGHGDPLMCPQRVHVPLGLAAHVWKWFGQNCCWCLCSLRPVRKGTNSLWVSCRYPKAWVWRTGGGGAAGDDGKHQCA